MYDRVAKLSNVVSNKDCTLSSRPTEETIPLSSCDPQAACPDPITEQVTRQRRNYRLHITVIHELQKKNTQKGE